MVAWACRICLLVYFHRDMIRLHHVILVFLLIVWESIRIVFRKLNCIDKTALTIVQSSWLLEDLWIMVLHVRFRRETSTLSRISLSINIWLLNDMGFSFKCSRCNLSDTVSTRYFESVTYVLCVKRSEVKSTITNNLGQLHSFLR